MREGGPTTQAYSSLLPWVFWL